MEFRTVQLSALQGVPNKIKPKNRRRKLSQASKTTVSRKKRKEEAAVVTPAKAILPLDSDGEVYKPRAIGEHLFFEYGKPARQSTSVRLSSPRFVSLVEPATSKFTTTRHLKSGAIKLNTLDGLFSVDS